MPYRKELKQCPTCHKNKLIAINKLFCGRTCSNKSRAGIKRPAHSIRMRLENNPKWSKKPNGGMDNLHAWLHRRIPKPELCEMCNNKPPMDLANRSQEYKHDLDDWFWLCRKCHKEYDGQPRGSDGRFSSCEYSRKYFNL